jgi:hypothetical protein
LRQLRSLRLLRGLRGIVLLGRIRRNISAARAAGRCQREKKRLGEEPAPHGGPPEQLLVVKLWLITVRGYAPVIFLSKQCSIQISFGMTCASRNALRMPLLLLTHARLALAGPSETVDFRAADPRHRGMWVAGMAGAEFCG